MVSAIVYTKYDKKNKGCMKPGKFLLTTLFRDLLMDCVCRSSLSFLRAKLTVAEACATAKAKAARG